MFLIYDIKEIKGVGQKLIDKIIESYGSYEEFTDAIRNYDIDPLLNIAGLSNQKALEIVRYMHGDNIDDFLKTSQSKNIYLDIIDRLLSFTNTDYARNRILLLSPTKDYNRIESTQELIKRTLIDTDNLDYDYIRELYSNIHELNENVRPKFNDEYAIVCEDYEDYMDLVERGFNRYCNVYAIESQVDFNEFEFIIYVYDSFNAEPGETGNIISVSSKSPDYEIQPNIILEFFKQNKDVLENVYNLRKYLHMDTCIEEVLKLLDNINVTGESKVQLIDVVEEVTKKTNDIIKEEIKNVDLTGDEVLELLNNENLPPKIMTIFDKHLEVAKDEIYERTSQYVDAFIIKYPLEIDYDELMRIEESANANSHLKKFEAELDTCLKLERYKQRIIDETLELIHYDYPFTLASFSKYYDLSIPSFGEEYILEGSLHLTLKKQQKDDGILMQDIDYNLDSNNNIILLTGANSGGKTTLLETLAQHTIMTYMGLGVCAKNAIIPKINEVYYFTKKHSLNAGAFETFLTSFIPVVIGEKNKLVLIDELESITELEAAIKIIIGFIEHIQDDDSYAIIVTHMAPEILKHTQNIKIRTDGIEAKGLDENYNLIVDRSPKINYLAKSTPELILKRIYEQSDEPIKSVYKDILDKFSE
ncbi:MAG: AAA family ATPase [Methanosphaera sp.]|nr:AAA family ATPase [Methanosphaera sp.]